MSLKMSSKGGCGKQSSIPSVSFVFKESHDQCAMSNHNREQNTPYGHGAKGCSFQLNCHHLMAFWLMTECRSRAYAILICLSSSSLSSLLLSSVSTPPDHMLGSNKVHTLHAHAAISCIVAHQKLYHSDLYLLYSSHICMFILMSIVHEVINIATSNLTETCI